MFHFRMDMPLHLMALYASMMIVIVLILRHFLRNRLPKYVFPLLWGLVLLRLLVPFSLSSPISAPVPEWQLSPSTSNSAVYVSNLVSDTAAAPGEESAPETVAYSFEEGEGAGLSWNRQLVLAIATGLGAAVTAGVLLAQKLRYSRKLRNSLLVEHNQTMNSILRDLGMGHILIFTNDEIASPLVCGVFNPRIYLPASMNFQQTSLLRHILTHEIMHIKRKDNWLKMIMLIALCLHWYNPLVWLMSKYLSSDMEAACDEAVLRQYHADERKGYATSLLSMAIAGNRSTLFYSSFAKTEVERRIQNILSYKKTTAFILSVSMLLVLTGTVVFATGGQAPFSKYLSSSCSSSLSHWVVKAELARDIVLGEHANQRADNVIISVLRADQSSDPDMISDQVKAALAKEFRVEKSAFQLKVDLYLTEDRVLNEYAEYGLTKGENGFYLYKGEVVRIYEDKMLGSMQSWEKGTVDISVLRDRLGKIVSVEVLKEGDRIFDRRTMEMEHSLSSLSYDTDSSYQTETIIEESE